MQFIGRNSHGIIVNIGYNEIAKIIDAHGPVGDYEVAFEDLWEYVKENYANFVAKEYHFNKLQKLLEREEE